MTSLCCPDTVLNLVARIDASGASSGTKRAGDEEASWQTSVRQWVDNLLRDFPLYPDLLIPFLAAVCQVEDLISLYERCRNAWFIEFNKS